MRERPIHRRRYRGNRYSRIRGPLLIRRRAASATSASGLNFRIVFIAESAHESLSVCARAKRERERVRVVGLFWTERVREPLFSRVSVRSATRVYIRFSLLASDVDEREEPLREYSREPFSFLPQLFVFLSFAPARARSFFRASSHPFVSSRVISLELFISLAVELSFYGSSSHRTPSRSFLSSPLLNLRSSSGCLATLQRHTACCPISMFYRWRCCNSKSMVSC